ncbi:hypothetical protein QOZ98_001429 [Planomicrobium stackebrandtii]|uniref:Uncharacterized protein n=1 Tax=Planomicrobium stackebrandtii TaxID=253160 RepID=A0ABU0GU55_9BACL|nr:hypothetical protein [Planomicrobium stackebrandtii]MDQ0428603.1 hypothetical protein [Planomicrobium stackebrandtii]
MKKTIRSLILVSLLVVILWAVNYLQTNYHKTPEAAFEELVQTSDATVFPLDDNRLALLLNQDGTMSIAHMDVERLFDIYKDFEVFPTKLTVFEDSLDKTIPYTTDPEFLEYSFGLIQNEKAAYTTWKEAPAGEERNVIPLDNFIEDPDLNGISLWTFPGAMLPVDLERMLVFLDGAKKPLSIEDKEFIMKKTEDATP